MKPPGKRIRVLVAGALGRMGRCVVEAIGDTADLELAGAVDVGGDLAATIRRERPDVAVDFTTPGAVESNLRCYLREQVHPVIGTTGLGPAALADLRAEAGRLGVG
ncbi:MAG: 4-hydroxy-tetrahydrodipicolinate reductase, partial [Planctomycetes bacterium]|nr:4-hydroxy-tetrahydrodipicolinate reductase [Planctomycetota bacterium]